MFYYMKLVAMFAKVYAKIVQTERNETCFRLPRCRLSYAKVVQTERNAK